MAFLQRFAASRLRIAPLTRALCTAAEYDDAHFEKLVKNNKVVVFMKGVPQEPRCGFSNAVVRILDIHGVESYDHHNILEDEDLRQGMKTFSSWPTFPQVYFNGEFLGGCDILLEMHNKGDLVDELQKVGIRSAVLDEDPKSS